MGKKSAQVLRGRLGFAYSQIVGLSGRMALQHISEHAFRRPFNATISQQLADSLAFLRSRLDEGLPRKVFKDVGNTFVILSDASVELDKSGGLGGILISSDGKLVSWFCLQLSPDMVGPFMKEDQEMAISELETLALFLCTTLWRSIIQCRHVLLCLDNEVARFGLIKCYSHAAMVCKMVNAIAIPFERNLILPWFLQVPSAANLSDFPSRNVDHPFLENDFKFYVALVKNAFNDVASDRLHADHYMRGCRGLNAGEAESRLNSNST